MALNKFIGLGRLTNEPETRTTNSGKTVVTFTVAIDRRFNRKECDFVNCVAWDKTGTFISSYFHKGSPICVAGALQIRSYEDKQGNKRTAAEIIVEEASFAGDKKSEDIGPNVPQYVPPDGKGFETLGDNDDLPF